MKSLSLERSLEEMGEDLRIARVRRRMTIDDMAARAGLNRKTVMKLEKGDGSASLQALGSVLVILGEEKRLSQLLDPGQDDVAILMDRDRLPQRVRTPRGQASSEMPDLDPDDTGFGMGF